MQQAQEVVRLLREHRVLLRAYADAQSRCSALLREQAERMRRMDAQLMRMRAALVRATTELAWEREERVALERSVPGLPRRLALGRQVAALQERVQLLTRERGRQALAAATGRAPHAPGQAGPALDGNGRHLAGEELVDAADIHRQADPEAELNVDLEAHLDAADLVICQTGCMSHGDYWRVQDHCRRTGMVCMLVDQPDGLQIVRIHRQDERGAEAAPAAVTSRR